MKQDLLTVNKWSRPGDTIGNIRGLVIHWVANPKTSAKFNRDYFEMRKCGKLGYGSAHVIIDLDGSALQCVPFEEVAYHAGGMGEVQEEARALIGPLPNFHTIGIEMCHPDWTGKPTAKTLETAIGLCAELCGKYSLAPRKILRHYDVTGKDCPKWFVEHPEEFEKFREEVGGRLSNKA